jgi:hypothetical protein
MKRQCFQTITAAVLVAFAFGCDQKSTTGSTSTSLPAPNGSATVPAVSQARIANMQQLWMVMHLAHDSVKLPAGLKDFEGKMEQGGPLPKAINDGQIVVNWNAPIKSPWWAYEKEALTAGGVMIVPDEKGDMKPKVVSADEAKRILRK